MYQSMYSGPMALVGIHVQSVQTSMNVGNVK